MTLVVAHRGASQAAPENTFVAFERAAEQGADAIEVDVHVTADGELPVIHDPTLDRTTDRTTTVATATTVGSSITTPLLLARAGSPSVRRC